jgi:hypothetical protein
MTGFRRAGWARRWLYPATTKRTAASPCRKPAGPRSRVPHARRIETHHTWPSEIPRFAGDRAGSSPGASNALSSRCGRQHFAIVGGGPTGVEMAGTLIESAPDAAGPVPPDRPAAGPCRAGRRLRPGPGGLGGEPVGAGRTSAGAVKPGGSHRLVIFDWAWATLTYQRNARVVADPEA